MKKVIFSLFLILFSIEFVSAKQTLYTCEYYKPYDQLSGSQQVGVLCNIYDDYSHQCYMEVGSNKATTSSNKEKIQNWGSAIGLDWSARDYVKNNNQCPNYMLIKIDNGINGYEIHAAEDMESLLELQQQLSGQRHSATLNGMEISDEKRKKLEEDIKSYTEAIHRVIDNYSLESCMKPDVTTTKLSDCKQILSNLKTNIYAWDINVMNWINEGYFKEEDIIIQDYRKATERANNFQETAGKEIEEEDKKIKDQLGLPTEDDKEKEPDVSGTPARNPGITFDDFCKQDGVRKAFKFLGYLIMVVKILVPLLLIILGVVDFGKAAMASDADAVSKASSTLIRRVITGIVIFFIPTLVYFVFGVIVNEETGYADCGTCIFEPSKCSTK